MDCKCWIIGVQIRMCNNALLDSIYYLANEIVSHFSWLAKNILLSLNIGRNAEYNQINIKVDR